jgi:hypothetical protein
MCTLHLQWFLLNKGLTFVLMFFVVMNAWWKSDVEILEKDLLFLVNGNNSFHVMVQVWGFCSRVVELHVLPGCDLCHWVICCQCFEVSACSQNIGNQLLSDEASYSRMMKTSQNALLTKYFWRRWVVTEVKLCYELSECLAGARTVCMPLKGFEGWSNLGLLNQKVKRELFIMYKKTAVANINIPYSQKCGVQVYI